MARICPECLVAKHQNCDGTSWDEAMDRVGECLCVKCARARYLLAKQSYGDLAVDGNAGDVARARERLLSASARLDRALEWAK